MNLEKQVSINVDDDEILRAGSETDESEFASFEIFTQNGMFAIGEGNSEYEKIEKEFISGMRMREFGEDTTVVSILKNSKSSFLTRARLDSFRIFSAAVANKCGGNANIRLGWYGGSKEEISQIVVHGFSGGKRSGNGVSYGDGVHLFPGHSLFSGALSTEVDENGLRHMLLCRVILGKMEQTSPASKQCLPTSQDFDSGVDNLLNPKAYIIWSAFMNTHIFPEYLISFKAPRLAGLQRTLAKKKPSSPYMSFIALIPELAKYLEPARMVYINEIYNDYQANKIGRKEMIKRVRMLVGDKLLAAVIMSHQKNPSQSQIN
ncbi:hypothetical protein UlMin_040284 [Ulmus minor]